MRKIIQIAFENTHTWDNDEKVWDPTSKLWALANDGSLWWFNDRTDEWCPMDIPLPNSGKESE